MLSWLVQNGFLYHCNHSDIQLLRHCLPVAYWTCRKLKKCEYTKEQEIKVIVDKYTAWAWWRFLLCFQMLYFIYNEFAFFLLLNTFKYCFFMRQSLILTVHKVTRFICLTNNVKEGYVSSLSFSKEGKMFRNIFTLRLIFNAYFWKLWFLQSAGSIIQLYFLRLYSLDLYRHNISKDIHSEAPFQILFFWFKCLEAFLVFLHFYLSFFVTTKIGMQSELP